MKNQKTFAKSRGASLLRWQMVVLVMMVIANIVLVWASLHPPREDFGGQMLLPMSSFESTPSR